MKNSKAFTVEVVLATGRQSDCDALRKILHGSPWRLIKAATIEEAVSALGYVEFPIVLFDPTIGGEQWETMLEHLLDARRRTDVVLLLDECDSSRSCSIACSQCDSLYRPLNRERVFSRLFLAYGRCKTYNLRLHAPPRLNTPLPYRKSISDHLLRLPGSINFARGANEARDAQRKRNADLLSIGCKLESEMSHPDHIENRSASGHSDETCLATNIVPVSLH